MHHQERLAANSDKPLSFGVKAEYYFCKTFLLIPSE